MILGYEEAKKVDGRFYEFQYETFVTKTEASKHFGCFQNTDATIIKLVSTVFCWSDKDFEVIVGKWQSQTGGLLDMYSYYAIGKVSEKSFRAEEIVELIYKRHNFKYLAHLVQFGSRDFIQC